MMTDICFESPPTEPPANAVRPTAIQRYISVVSWTLALSLALLTFPGQVPLMIAAWLLAYSLRLWQGRPGWCMLAACVAVLLIKGVCPIPGLVLLGVVCLLAVAVELVWQRRLQSLTGGLKIGLAAAVWLTWGLAAVDWHRSSHAGQPLVLDERRPIVCLGDSLTENGPEGGYPEALGQRVAAPVINLGRPGISASDALSDLPYLASLQPQLVVIELGGHDYLKGVPRQETRATLQRLITGAQQAGAAVLLVEIPRGFVTDPYWGLERELARENDLTLLEDSAIRQLVLWSPIAPPGMWLPDSHLSDDGLHPNSRGQHYLAERILSCLQAQAFQPDPKK